MAVSPGKTHQHVPSTHTRLIDRLAERLGNFLTSYVSIIITVFLGLVVLAAVLGPILSYLGLVDIARTMFFSMHLLCAQTPSHSFYLFGHQLCLCERCLAIYSSMFTCSLAFVLSRKRLPGIPWWAWALLSVPMALDGFTQMFGLRESTWELRLITGILFGFSAIWFVLPMMQKSLDADMARAQQVAAVISRSPSPARRP